MGGNKITTETNNFLRNSLKDLAGKYVTETSVLQRIVTYLGGLSQNETVDVKWVFYEIIKNQEISDTDRALLEKIGREYL